MALHGPAGPFDNSLPNLRWGTAAENAWDRDIRDGNGERSPRGENHGNAKLTAEDVRQIRLRHQEGEQQKNLAAEFGISRSAVCSIIKGRLWKHI
jgi:hypothetical protein